MVSSKYRNIANQQQLGENPPSPVVRAALRNKVVVAMRLGVEAKADALSSQEYSTMSSMANT
jgi:hypothetical protein